MILVPIILLLTFAVILCKYVFKNGIQFSVYSPIKKAHETEKIAVYRCLSFFAILTVVYSLILAPTLIQVAHAVYVHTQFR